MLKAFGNIILIAASFWLSACRRDNVTDTHISSQARSQLFVLKNAFAERTDWLSSLPADVVFKLNSNDTPESLAGYVNRSGPYVVDMFGGVIRFRVRKNESMLVVAIWSSGANLIDESGAGDDIITILELETEPKPITLTTEPTGSDRKSLNRPPEAPAPR